MDYLASGRTGCQFGRLTSVQDSSTRRPRMRRYHYECKTLLIATASGYFNDYAIPFHYKYTTPYVHDRNSRVVATRSLRPLDMETSTYASLPGYENRKRLQGKEMTLTNTTALIALLDHFYNTRYIELITQPPQRNKNCSSIVSVP
jgi:hypothetical protein